MLRDEETTLSYISTKSGKTRHITLIDPAKQDPEVAANRAMVAVECGTEMIFVGGSTDTPDEVVHATCVAIQESLELRVFAASQDPNGNEDSWKIPVVLFPGGAHALSPAADAITFMMLMNSTNPRFLIEEQVAGAPFIAKAGIVPIPMGYVICSPGGKAGEVGQANLIQPTEVERVSAYAMTAQAYGFKMFYLEAGSGAQTPVNPELIRVARNSCDLTLVVGGGIRDGATARKAAEAGADWVITGNLSEGFEDVSELQRALTDFIDEMNSHLY